MTKPYETDAEFAARVLAQCPQPKPHDTLGDGGQTALAARIMADFDATALRKRNRWNRRLRGWLTGYWPGTLWQPGMALAASLAVGVVVGAVIFPQTAPTANPVATQSVVAQEDDTTPTVGDTIPVIDMLGDFS